MTSCRARHCILPKRIEAVVPSGRPVGILSPNNAFFPVAALACLTIGRPFVPIDCSYPATRNDRIVQEAGMLAVIVDRASGTREMAASLPCLDIGTSLAATDDRKVD